MLGVAMHTTIQTLMEKGLNKSQISRATGHDWKTVSKVLEKIKLGEVFPDQKPHPKLLDPYRDKVLELLGIGLTARRIHEEIRRLGLQIGYTTVADYIKCIKQRENIYVRIHTEPGEEVQIDFGYVGYTPDNSGKNRKTWVFNMKMSHSRKDYYKKVYDQRVETFIECHEEGFLYFGGVPEYVRIDNLKAAVLKANFYEPIYQRLYQNFAEHYGFKIIPCRIYHPNDKGKVESGIKYVKGNFFAGRNFSCEDDLDLQLYKWQEKTCNTRIHGTTRKVPNEVFSNEEKSKLRLLPRERFRMPENSKRKVYHDCHIYVKYNYYSVPYEYVGKEVDIELSADILKVYCLNKTIALHQRLQGRGQFSTLKSHYPRYKVYSETENQERYQVKMADIGSYAEQMFFAIVQNQSRDWGQPVRGILSLLKKYPKRIINLACKRALAFKVYKYQTIKKICENGSYVLPVEFNIEEAREYEYA